MTEKLANLILNESKRFIEVSFNKEKSEQLEKTDEEKNILEDQLNSRKLHKLSYILNSYKESNSFFLMLFPLCLILLPMSSFLLLRQFILILGQKTLDLTLIFSYSFCSFMFLAMIVGFLMCLYNDIEFEKKTIRLQKLERERIKLENKTIDQSYFYFEDLLGNGNVFTNFVSDFRRKSVCLSVLNEMKSSLSENKIREILEKGNNNGIFYGNIIDVINEKYKENKHDLMYKKITSS